MSRTPAHGAGGAPGPRPVRAKPAAAQAAGARPQAAPAPTPANAAQGPVNGSSGAVAPAVPAKPISPVVAYLRKPEVIKYGSAGLAALLVIGVLVWRPWVPRPPRLNEDPGTIAKFAATHLESMPFDQQRQFMDVLDEKDKGVEQAYEDGKLSDQEYRRALQLAWYGEHLKKMDKFFAKPPTLRALYLDSLVDKKHKKKAKAKGGPKSDPKAALKADEIERDDTTEAQDIKHWPADVRQRWTEYRMTLASRKQYWKDQKEQHKKGAPA